MCSKRNISIDGLVRFDPSIDGTTPIHGEDGYFDELFATTSLSLGTPYYTVTKITNDSTLFTNSSTKLTTEHSVRGYVDTYIDQEVKTTSSPTFKKLTITDSTLPPDFSEITPTRIKVTDNTDTSYMEKDSLHSKYIYPNQINYQTNDIYLKGTDINTNSMIITSKELLNTYMSKTYNYGTITITNPGPIGAELTVQNFSGTLFNPENKKKYDWDIVNQILPINTSLGPNSTLLIKYDIGTGSAILAQGTDLLPNIFTSIPLALIIHPGGTIISTISNDRKGISLDSLTVSFQDYLNKFQNTFLPYGLNYYGNALNRRLGRTSGSVFAIGENYISDKTDPNSKPILSYDPVSFYYAYRLVLVPASDSDYYISPTPSLIDIPLTWDNGSGTLTACSVAKYYIGMFYYNPRTPNPNGNNAYIFPQTEYASLDTARIALTEGTYNPYKPSTLNTFWIRTAICFRGNVTDFGSANIYVKTVQYSNASFVQTTMSCDHSALSNLSYDLSGHTDFQRKTINLGYPPTTEGSEIGNFYVNSLSTPPSIYSNLKGTLGSYEWHRLINENPLNEYVKIKNLDNSDYDITIGTDLFHLTITDKKLNIYKRGENAFMTNHLLAGVSTWHKIGSYIGTTAASRTCWFEVFTGGESGSNYANVQELLHSFKSGDPNPFYTMHWQKGSSVLSGTTAPRIAIYYDSPTLKIYIKTATTGRTFIQFKNNELINNNMTTHGTGLNPDDATTIIYDTSDTTNYPPNSGIYCGRFASYQTSTKYIQSNPTTSTFTNSLDTSNYTGTTSTFSGTNTTFSGTNTTFSGTTMTCNPTNMNISSGVTYNNQSLNRLQTSKIRAMSTNMNLVDTPIPVLNTFINCVEEKLNAVYAISAATTYPLQVTFANTYAIPPRIVWSWLLYGNTPDIPTYITTYMTYLKVVMGQNTTTSAYYVIENTHPTITFTVVIQLNVEGYL